MIRWKRLELTTEGWPLWGAALFFFFLALNIFAPGLEFPTQPFFDEVRYVPAAREFLNHGINQNWSHPPLGKALIAAGIGLFGDHPAGWRAMSVLFGSGIVGLMYLWSLLLLRSRWDAAWVALLTILNQVLFVQARVATLDIFMLFFTVAGWGAFTRTWLRPEGKSVGGLGWILLSSTCFGLAIAAKWPAVISLVACAVLLALKHRREFWPRGVKALLLFVGAPLLAYLVAFSISLGMRHPAYAPTLSGEGSAVKAANTQYGLRDLVPLQFRMLTALRNFENAAHLGNSPWYQWPIGGRPTWWYRESGAVNQVGYERGVGFFGNPFVFGVGLVSLPVCLFLAWRRRSREAVLLCTLYLGNLLAWAVLPRSTTFLYYYLPSALILAPMIVLMLRKQAVSRPVRYAFLGMAILSFLYFRPILSGDRLDPLAFETRGAIPKIMGDFEQD